MVLSAPGTPQNASRVVGVGVTWSARGRQTSARDSQGEMNAGRRTGCGLPRARVRDGGQLAVLKAGSSDRGTN